jgi:hypothetical protein
MEPAKEPLPVVGDVWKTLSVKASENVPDDVLPAVDVKKSPKLIDVGGVANALASPLNVIVAPPLVIELLEFELNTPVV